MAFLSDVYADYVAKLGISRPLTRNERQRALFAHIAAMAAPPQEQELPPVEVSRGDLPIFARLAGHQTSTPEIAARVGEAFARLAEDEAHESS